MLHKHLLRSNQVLVLPHPPNTRKLPKASLVNAIQSLWNWLNYMQATKSTESHLKNKNCFIWLSKFVAIFLLAVFSQDLQTLLQGLNLLELSLFLPRTICSCTYPDPHVECLNYQVLQCWCSSISLHLFRLLCYLSSCLSYWHLTQYMITDHKQYFQTCYYFSHHT